ncbi:NAD-dependent succinate-semialdehyde dehydrogenase [Egibacter rhizosphaerae]|uniref:NAD-dependent succinate-semialdehyde dehydrogenase n=1 Tax=Egibacter rhizosphaerae TaxID=1670831 RepID=A0A411YBH0_9ACTN|nr:NAD-dependent succinate-semialdehyde dehydrogenase [Egibacter rhizosphaerae]QBI18554.1 NAD-dependent succinate-semialdehyde dehydrogenase [Egibacter rhizosphaerae]
MTTIEDPTRALEPAHRRLRIGDVWLAASSGMTFGVEDPATGDVIAEVADGGEADARAALAAAEQVRAVWERTAPRARSELLYRVYEVLLERRDELAALMTAEMGKPLADSRGEIGYAAEFFRWFAEEAVRLEGRYSTAPSGDFRIVTVPKPVGPSVLVTPWNFPMAMGARKIAPALAAGCPTVTKPARQTPLSMLALARILEECGAPAGTVNIVTTTSSGPVVGALLADDRTRKLSFTGSTEVGRGLLEKAAPNILRTSMELGGNAPFIVCDDADLDPAVEGAMLAKMRNMGEACTAANRFYASTAIADEFAERLAERMRALTVGHGLEDGVDVGPLIDEPAVAKVEDLVEDATRRGAEVLTGGERPSERGYFYAPTVLSRVPADAELASTEIFGPVAPVGTFDSDDEVIARANDTEHGLVAYVYTQDIDRALRFAEELETGMLGINRGLVSDPAAPFGGVKHSGLGREGSHEGLDEYVEYTYAAVSRR